MLALLAIVAVVAADRLTRFEKANEMLVNCNALAAIRFDRASRDLRAHCLLLQDLKKDMEGMFRRIRSLRNKLSHDFPHAFACASLSLTLDYWPDRRSLALQPRSLHRVPEPG